MTEDLNKILDAVELSEANSNYTIDELCKVEPKL